MIRLPMILAVAGAEMRSTRRLFRYWLFTILAVLISTALFAQYTVMHGMASYQSATLGAMSPRMLIASVGMFTILVFVAGLIFLAFEVRARDVRDRMTEILDSRPLSNFELVLGKVGGIVFMVWLPLVLITSPRITDGRHHRALVSARFLARSPDVTGALVCCHRPNRRCLPTSPAGSNYRYRSILSAGLEHVQYADFPAADAHYLAGYGH